MASASGSAAARPDLKLVLLGAANAGKTSILNRLVCDEFLGNTVANISVAFTLYAWRDFRLGVWDTAGQERLAELSAMYCRGAGAALLVYDVTDRTSFERLDRFLELLRKGAEASCAIVVAANKADLVLSSPERRTVTAEEGMAYATKVGAIAYLETSALTGANVAELVERIGLHVFRDELARRASLPSSPGASGAPTVGGAGAARRTTTASSGSSGSVQLRAYETADTTKAPGSTCC